MLLLIQGQDTVVGVLSLEISVFHIQKDLIIMLAMINNKEVFHVSIPHVSSSNDTTYTSSKVLNGNRNQLTTKPPKQHR